MKMYSKDLGSSIHYIPEKSTWRLWTEIDDWGDAVIKLEINGVTHQHCDSWEYIQGQARLDSFDVLDFYVAVVKHVYGMIKEDSVDYINLETIKDAVMPAFWNAWRKRGIVDGENWKYLEVTIQ